MDPNVAALEEALREIRSQRDAVLNEAATTRSMAIYNQLTERLLHLERQLALRKEEPVAVPLEWAEKWTNSSRFCHYYGMHGKAYVFYDHCASYAVQEEGVAIVELLDVYATKCGGPNDEVIEGHPLFGKGIARYGAFRVENSLWKAELEGVNKVHRQYDATFWTGLKHFLWLFHDGQIEALARGFAITRNEGRLEDVIPQFLHSIKGLSE